MLRVASNGSEIFRVVGECILILKDHMDLFAIFIRKYRKKTRILDVTGHLVPLGTAVFSAQMYVDPVWSQLADVNSLGTFG